VFSLTALPLARWIDPEAAHRRLDAVAGCYNRRIEGHHHFHMDRPHLIGAPILEFLTATEAEHVPAENRDTGP
jgi:hypothetical protein